MMVHIPAVFTAQEVAQLRAELLSQGVWQDGRATAGAQGASVKQNRQLDPHHPLSVQLASLVQQRLRAHPQFVSAALPHRMLRPLFNRYSGGGHYGWHVDGAMMQQPDSPGLLRSDVSTTLFLSDPCEYDGGELIVRDTYGEHLVRLPAGDAIVYPASSLHQVTPVNAGERIAAFLWTQSLVRRDAHRTLLFELDQTVQRLRAQLGETADTVALSAHYHNLLREWAEA